MFVNELDEADLKALKKWREEQAAEQQQYAAENKEPKELPYYNENSAFKLSDVVYVKGQDTLMTVVRCYIDEKAGPMVEACWIMADGHMNLASLPEEVFVKFGAE